MPAWGGLGPTDRKSAWRGRDDQIRWVVAEPSPNRAASPQGAGCASDRPLARRDRGRALFGPRFPVVRLWKVHLPARYRTEHQCGSLAIAGRDVAHPIDGSAFNGFLARAAAAPAISVSHPMVSPIQALGIPAKRARRRECSQRYALGVPARYTTPVPASS